MPAPEHHPRPRRVLARPPAGPGPRDGAHLGHRRGRPGPEFFRRSDRRPPVRAGPRGAILLGPIDPQGSANFTGLVLGCIETKFCNQTSILQNVESLLLVQNYLADFLKKLQNFATNRKNLQIFATFPDFCKKSADFCENR